MFESTIIDTLAADTNLTALLNTYSGEPSIFSNEAPQEAELPFMVIRIEGSSRNVPVQSYSLFVDFFDFYQSRVNAREAARFVQYDLDGKRLQHANFTDLRIWQFSGPSFISGDDSRDIQMNIQFEIRATLTTNIYEV